METLFDLLVIIICLVWGILNIILFFKLWAACNNIRSIRNDIRRIADKYDPDGKAAREQAKAEAEKKEFVAFIDK